MPSSLMCCVCGVKSEKKSDCGNFVQRGKDVGFFGTMNSECNPYYFCPECMIKVELHVQALSEMLKLLKYPHFDSLVRTVKDYQEKRDGNVLRN